MWSRSRHIPPKLCLPMFLSAPRTSTERSRWWFSRDGLSRPVSVARPGNACHFPADLPFPGTRGRWGPFQLRGRGGGFLLLSHDLKGFARCHLSSGAGLFRITFRGLRTGLNIPGVILHFP